MNEQLSDSNQGRVRGRRRGSNSRSFVRAHGSRGRGCSLPPTEKKAGVPRLSLSAPPTTAVSRISPANQTTWAAIVRGTSVTMKRQTNVVDSGSGPLAEINTKLNEKIQEYGWEYQPTPMDQDPDGGEDLAQEYPATCSAEQPKSNHEGDREVADED